MQIYYSSKKIIKIYSMILMVAFTFVLCISATALADGLLAPQWTDKDRQQLLQCALLVNKKNYQNALPLIIPLYQKSPYHVEKYYAEDFPPDFPAWPKGIPYETSPIGLLFNVMLNTKQYPIYFALESAARYHKIAEVTFEESLAYQVFPERMKKSQEHYTFAVAINDLWIDFKPAPTKRDETIFVPLVQLGQTLKMEVKSNNSATEVRLRMQQTGKEFIFKAGKVDVTSSKDKIEMKHAPFKQDGSMMISLQDMADLLGGKVYSFPDVYLSHAIFPGVEEKAEK